MDEATNASYKLIHEKTTNWLTRDSVHQRASLLLGDDLVASCTPKILAEKN